MEEKAKNYDFGKKMKAARLAAGLSQQALSMKTGWPQPYISKLENSHVDVRYSTMCQMAEFFGCTVEFVPKKD